MSSVNGIRQSDDGTTVVGGITVNTPYESDSDKSVKVEDFLQLMIAQLTNQDFMDPVDDTQYVTQLAQFATMQSMQELSYYSQTNYATSMVGKTVTAAYYGLGGQVNRETGVVTKVDYSGDEFTFTVNGKEFTMSQIMTVNDGLGSVTESDLAAANKITLISYNIGTNSVNYRWTPPVEGEEAQAELVYDVYYMPANNSIDFNDLASVKSNGTKAASGLTDPEFNLTGLDPDTTYYVNVVVRNQAGDEAVYEHSTVKTKEA